MKVIVARALCVLGLAGVVGGCSTTFQKSRPLTPDLVEQLREATADRTVTLETGSDRVEIRDAVFTPNHVSTVPIEAISTISWRSRRNGATDGALVGMGLGGVAGAIIGVSVFHGGVFCGDPYEDCVGVRIAGGVGGAILGGLVGAGLGALIGSAIGHEYRLEFR